MSDKLYILSKTLIFYLNSLILEEREEAARVNVLNLVKKELETYQISPNNHTLENFKPEELSVYELIDKSYRKLIMMLRLCPDEREKEEIAILIKKVKKDLIDLKTEERRNLK